jgi:MFS family permease
MAASAGGAKDARGRSSSPLLALFLTVLVDVLALTIVLPLLPFLAQRYGASPLVATSLFACFSVCQFFSGPVLGRISDRVGRKPTLLVSQLGTFVGLLLIGLTNRLELLFVGRIIDGLTAGNLTIAQAYITDVTRPENRTRAFGLIGIAFGVGFLIGPALSGVIGKHLGYHAPFLFAAGLSALSVTLTATLLPALPPKGKDKPHETRLELFRRFMSNLDTRGRILELFFFTWSFSTLTSGLALFLERRMSYDVAEVGYVFAFSGIVGGSMQGVIGRLARRIGEGKLSLVGLGLMGVGYVVLSQTSALSTLLVATAIGGVGSAFARPALTTLLTHTVHESEQGLALGLSQAGASIAQTVGPLLGGWLIEAGHLSGWAFLAGGLSAAAFGVRAVLPAREHVPTPAEAPTSDAPVPENET